MKYELKSFLLNMVVVLFGLLGLAQFCAFVGGESSFSQMLLVAPACIALSYEACRAERHITRAHHRRAVALRVIQNDRSRFVA